MAWIESHQSLGSHIKLKRLARELNIHRAQAIGHLHLLWWWSLDNAPSGNLSALSTVELAEVSEWPGNVDKYAAALKACGWIDSNGCIHDWWEYAGKLVSQRNKDKERKRKEREAEKNALSGGCPPDVHRTGDGCPPDGGRTADVPNPTQPNPTFNDPSTQGAREGVSGVGVTFPTFGDVKAYGSMQNIPEEFCEKFWLHYESTCWVDKNGNRITSWQSKLRGLWIKEQADIAKGRNGNKPPVGERKEIPEKIQIRKAVFSGNE